MRDTLNVKPAILWEVTLRMRDTLNVKHAILWEITLRMRDTLRFEPQFAAMNILYVCQEMTNTN